MVMNISSALNAYRQTAQSGLSGNGVTRGEAENFGDTLKNFIGDSVETIRKGEQAAAAGTAGKADMQSVVIALDKASVSLETLIAIKDRVVMAYQEIIKMQV